MIKIKLSVNEKTVLDEIIKNDYRYSFFLINPNKFYLESDKDSLIDLRERCSDYLLYVGFDNNYCANEKGIILERLIDKLTNN